MHYPNGPDPGLLDPDVRSKSKWEAEACLFGNIVCKTLGLDSGYNDRFLLTWQGDASRIDYATVYQKAAEIIQHYRTHAKEEDFEEIIQAPVFVPERWDRVPAISHNYSQGGFSWDSGEPGFEGSETDFLQPLPLARWGKG